jgi:hypothetical protein
MSTRFERFSALTGVLAVALWLVGFVIVQGLANPPSDKATDAQVLSWVQDKTNYILTGGWLFMIGCICFVWFAAALRSRLAAAEGGTGMLSTLAFGGALAAALGAFGFPGGDFATAINKNDVSASTAGALHHVGNMFFVVTELSAVLLLVAVGMLAFRTRVLPRWWGVVGIVLAVVLLVGPIGWLGVILGLPVWTLVTSLMLALRRQPAGAASLAPATA